MGLVYVVGFFLGVSLLRYLVRHPLKSRRREMSVSSRWKADHRH